MLASGSVASTVGATDSTWGTGADSSAAGAEPSSATAALGSSSSQDKFVDFLHSTESVVNQVQLPNYMYYSGKILLTPKFGKESDLWVRFDEESVRWKEGFSQMYSAKRSAVGYLLPFGKGTVELILRNWTVTWLKQEGRMDG
jgi:hypothetical protein